VVTSQIVCNITSKETRVALLENGVITELFTERSADRGYVGNTYKGTVTKVLPGMQVAFVDIGLPKAGFLYVSDVIDAPGAIDEDGEACNDELSDETRVNIAVELEVVSRQQESRKIEEMLTEGETIMVQVSKDPLGTKGARITTHITLPGRHLVFMPTIDQVGVSRRIEDEEEKRRLRDTVKQLKKSGTGYIVRTAAEGKDEADLARDISFLEKLWDSITDKYDAAPAPSVLSRELNLIQRTIRDYFSADYEKVIIDNQDVYDETVTFCRSYLPDIVDRIERYKGAEPLFDLHGVEMEIERALGRKVWLKSGGYIVIDQTEALTAIDVNTGKFVGKTSSQEETILKTNLEAVKEIVYQLRLRNLGGLILIDFIDMEIEESKEKVFSALEEALKKDRSRTNILKISDLGIVEMTRKRVRESLSRALTDTCPHCDGRGVVKSAATVLYEVYRQIRRVARGKEGTGRTLVCNVAPAVADLMFDEESPYLDQLEEELGVSIAINTDYSLHIERFLVDAGK
jgi:ribonuclease G